jgi:hypothetical protein
LQRLHRSIAHVTGDVATVRVNVVAVSSESVRHRARRVQSINSAACTVLHAARVCVSRPSPMAKKKKRTRDPDAVTFENPLDDVENQDLEQPRGGGFEEEDDTPTHDVKKLKKMNIKKLRAQALKEGLPAGTILDAGNDKGQLIDLIMNGPSDEDGLSWAQKATAAREESGKKDKDAINLDFHEFESEAPKSSNHFEVEVEVAVVDYWLDDPDQSYLPCTNGQKLNIGCIAYSLTLPCLWRLAFGKTKLP